jgi:hypothetical protein
LFADRVQPSLGDKDSELEEVVADLGGGGNQGGQDQQPATYREDVREIGAIDTTGDEQAAMADYPHEEEVALIEEERRQALLQQIRDIEQAERHSFAPAATEPLYATPLYDGGGITGENAWPPLSTGGNEELLQTSDNNNGANELLTITIDIGGGQQENIQVFEGDDPADLARAFAVKHNLDPKLTDLLAAQIQSNIDQVLSAAKYEEEEQPVHEEVQEEDGQNNSEHLNQ